MAMPLVAAVVAALVTAGAMSALYAPEATSAASVEPEGRYAEDRAAIEDLQARYPFAPDFHDPDTYVSTFTEDGVLDDGSGEVHLDVA